MGGDDEAVALKLCGVRAIGWAEGVGVVLAVGVVELDELVEAGFVVGCVRADGEDLVGCRAVVALGRVGPVVFMLLRGWRLAGYGGILSSRCFLSS